MLLSTCRVDGSWKSGTVPLIDTAHVEPITSLLLHAKRQSGMILTISYLLRWSVEPCRCISKIGTSSVPQIIYLVLMDMRCNSLGCSSARCLTVLLAPRYPGGFLYGCESDGRISSVRSNPLNATAMPDTPRVILPGPQFLFADAG